MGSSASSVGLLSGIDTGARIDWVLHTPEFKTVSAKINKWTEKTRELLGSGKKLSVQEAQDLLEGGEKLNVNSKELKELKAKLTAAENWLNKVSKCVNGHTSLSSDGINELVQEHETLLVEMPEEVEELKQAVVGYCLCRRPYEGFMIGCDHCEVSQLPQEVTLL